LRALAGPGGCQATGTGAGIAAGAAATAGALACPGLRGAMPGRATPRTVFCADARRGAPAWLAGWVGGASGGGGGDGYVGGAMPIMVPANWRGGWLGETAGWAGAGEAAAAGGTKVGGAMPIIVPRRLALAGWGFGASGGAGAAAAAGGGSGGAMTMVPPKPVAAAGKSNPQTVQVVCWSRFCVLQRPHCFISRRTIAFSGCCRGARDGVLRAGRPAQIGRGFVRIRRFDLWG
jgi:hypothetical protein